MDKRLRIIGVGSALVDQLAQVPEAFLATVRGGKGGMVLVDDAEMAAVLARLPRPPAQAPGGSAANTAVGAARLGLPARLLAKVGADANGAFYRQALDAAGVAGVALKESADAPTGRCLALVTPDRQRTMRTCLGASATLSPAEITVADFADCALAHIEGYLLFNDALMQHVLATAKAAGCRVSLDLAAPEIVREKRAVLPRLLREYADIVFANEDEAAEFAGTRDARAALQQLRACCPTAAVKLGVRGALIAHGNEVCEVPARVVKAVDTTGAGDLWAAGFLYGLLNGLSPYDAGCCGAWAGAEVVQVTGAVIPEQGWQRLRCEIAALKPRPAPRKLRRAGT